MLVDAAPVPMGTRILSIAEWIITAGLVETPAEALIAGLRSRLNEAGIAVGRIQVAFRILHPLFGAVIVTGDDASGVVTDMRSGEDNPDSEFARSPFGALLASGRTHLRARLDDPHTLARYAILSLLAARGFTDYSAHAVLFGPGQLDGNAENGVVISFATKAPEGFADEQLEALRWLSAPFGFALKVEINRQITWNALRTFHGPVVGGRILGGMIKRGSGERIRTVVWYSDLRNSTALGETLRLDAFLSLLNAYFDCTAGAILAHGGEVLELIGDAVLGIFPVASGMADADACLASIEAAREARRRLQKLAETTPALAGSIDFGIGLHLGEVIFGNVGTQDRLSFGLVGGIVSETARMETLTKAVGRSVVVSDAVAAALDQPLDDLGEHRLRGVEGLRRVWAVPLHLDPPVTPGRHPAA